MRPLCGIAAAAIVVLAATPAAAPATDYFVDPAGSDANSGLSVAQAFKTVRKGAGTAVGGDTVHVRSGSYDEAAVRVNSGGPGNPVTIVADGNAVMDAHSRLCQPGKSLGAGAPLQAFYVSNVHDVVIDGIEITGYCEGGISALFSTDVTFRNLHVHHNGLNLRKKGGYGIAANRVNDLLIEDNVVTDNVPHSYISGSGISAFKSDSVIVRDNISDRNNGNGILIEDVTNGLVERNLARHNVGDFGTWGTAGIWLDGGHTVTLRNNWLEGNVWDGLDISDEDNQDPYAYEIHDNVVIGGWYGLRVDGIGAAGAAPDRIFGNTFVDAEAAGMKVYNRTTRPQVNTQVVGNLFAQLGADRPALEADDGSYRSDFVLDGNLYHRAGGKPVLWGYPFWVPYNTDSRAPYERTFSEYQALTGWDGSGLTGNPLFVNAAAGDYHLSAGSPAIDAGSPAYAADSDYDGHPRPQGAGPDIGALEGAGPCAPGACQPGVAGSSAYDSQIRPVKPMTVKLKAGEASVTRILKVNVRNGDTSPKDQLGHRIQLHAADGSCPAGTVSGVPAFRNGLHGPPQTAFMAGGRSLPAHVELEIDRAAFGAVTQCTLQLSVTTPLIGNVDPVPSNDSAAVPLNVSAQ